MRCCLTAAVLLQSTSLTQPVETFSPRRPRLVGTAFLCNFSGGECVFATWCISVVPGICTSTAVAPITGCAATGSRWLGQGRCSP